MKVFDKDGKKDDRGMWAHISEALQKMLHNCNHSVRKFTEAAASVDRQDGMLVLHAANGKCYMQTLLPFEDLHLSFVVTSIVTRHLQPTCFCCWFTDVYTLLDSITLYLMLLNSVSDKSYVATTCHAFRHLKVIERAGHVH